MDSIDDILQKLKDGEEVALCDIYQAVSLEGKKGGEMRLAALLAWVTNSAGSDGADTLLQDIKDLLTGLISADRLQVEVLGMLGESRQLAVTNVSAEMVLTTTCRRVRVTAVTADICLRAGTGSIGSAVTTDHYLIAGTSMDFAVAENSKIAAIRAGATNGTLAITELLPA